MKKNRLYTGLGFMLAGSIFLILFIFMRDMERASLFAGFAGALIAPGIMEIYKYFHWTRPENKAIYEVRMKNERINLKDERKVMLRGYTALVMYKITILIIVLLDFVAALFHADKWVAIVLTALLIFEVVGGYVVYRYYDKKM